MKINNIFNYKEIERVDVNNKRHYLVDNLHLPSVTTILDYNRDMTALDDWRKRVGEEEARKISKESQDIGTLVHTHVENYILGIDRPGGTNLIRKQSEGMADIIIENAMPHIDEVWGVEIKLYYPHLYAGTCDLVGLYKGKPTIMDNKTTNRTKKKEYIESYFCQLCAYADAHNFLYGTNIQQGVLFMVSKNLEYTEWFIDGEEFLYYRNIWHNKVEKYIENFS